MRAQFEARLVVFMGNDRARMNGGLGGLQAGYNLQINNWVWGIEGDFQGTDERGGSTFCFTLGGPPAYRLRSSSLRSGDPFLSRSLSQQAAPQRRLRRFCRGNCRDGFCGSG